MGGESTELDHGAFMEKFLLRPPAPSSPDLPLNALTFAIKDLFDVEGHVSGFGNPDWARTHPPASSTAPAVLSLLRAGATLVGTTVMDEMAYCMIGENKHYGIPRNPYVPGRVPGGSSSGSAVAVAAMLVDFSLGTDTGGSVRIPASHCGIFGFRPSHGAVSTNGVIPMAQSFDTVGWFARDPGVLNRVGRVLLQLPKEALERPPKIIITEDCFRLLSIPCHLVTGILVKAVAKSYGGQFLKHVNLGDYVKDNVPSLKQFMGTENKDQEYGIPSLAALSRPMRWLQRYEFKNNHSEWITRVKPNFGPGILDRVQDALETTGENMSIFQSIKCELRDALSTLLGDYGILAIPTVPVPPPKLQADPAIHERFRAKAASLLSIAGVSGFCQVSIPLGMYDNLPVSISLLATHGSDGFLLNVVESLYGTLEEEAAGLLS